MVRRRRGRRHSVGPHEAEAGFLEVTIECEGAVDPALTHHLEAHRVNQAQVVPAGRNHRGDAPLVQFASDPLDVDDGQEIVSQHADGGAAEPALCGGCVRHCRSRLTGFAPACNIVHMKRTNLVLDEALLEEATRLSAQRTYSKTVDLALSEFVRRARAGTILALAGSGLWDGDLSDVRRDVPKKSKRQAAHAAR